jgi:hypothetical protein
MSRFFLDALMRSLQLVKRFNAANNYIKTSPVNPSLSSSESMNDKPDSMHAHSIRHQHPKSEDLGIHYMRASTLSGIHTCISAEFAEPRVDSRLAFDTFELLRDIFTGVQFMMRILYFSAARG